MPLSRRCSNTWRGQVANNSRSAYWVRKAHRWLGLLIGIQLLLWTVSGLYFSLVPIETVRGEDRVRALRLRRVLDAPVYEINYQVGGESRIQLADAGSGVLLPPVNREQAIALARVTARRNSTWRLFDFLWMLHIMDFEDRDDFNTGLLQLFAILGVITIVSGFILWAMTTSLFRGRQQ